MNRYRIRLLVFCFVLTSCSFLRGDRQPAVSQDPSSIQQFTKDTTFPYFANAARSAAILQHYGEVKVGMDGHEVLRIMGNPDEAEALHFVLDPPYAWAWKYCINKQYRSAPDDNDNQVEIFFDLNGHVEGIDVKPYAPSGPITTTNTAIKVANLN